MLRCVTNIAGVRIIPSPQVLIVESTDSWLTFKLIYYIDNYGQQYVIGDKVLTRLMSELSKAGIQLASNRLAISK
jgi:small-conductance mechanosensitive channel